MTETPSPPIRSSHDLLQYEKTLDCVHCGLCLASCPTYDLLSRETTSPRGRIYLMRGLAEGKIEPTAPVVRDLDLCLVCRACEPVCPAGVHFGEMMEFVRTEILEDARAKTLKDHLRRFAVRRLIPYPRRLRWLAHVIRFGEWSGVRGLLKRLGVLRRISPDLDLRDELLPPMPPAAARRRLPANTVAGGVRRGRVAVLEGCVMPLLLGDTNRATVRVLAEQGFDVVVPRTPVCCGALSAHFGSLDVARQAALTAIAAFDSVGEVDAVVVNSAGCAAMMKEYGRLLHDGDGASAAQHAAARALAAKVRDVSEFLSEQGIRPPRGRIEARVAYADACHLGHAQGVRDQPREVLVAIPGIRLVPLERADRCCGAAGLYNALHPQLSMRLLEDKIDDLRRSQADVLATGNPGCLMQWRAGVRRAGLAIEVVHPIELFDRATRAEPDAG